MVDVGLFGLHDVNQAAAGFVGFGRETANIGRHLGIERRLNHRMAFVSGQLGSGLVGRHRDDERDGGRSESLHCGVQRFARSGAYQDLIGGESFVRGKLGVEGGEFLVMVAIRAADHLRHGVDGSLRRSFGKFIAVDPNRVGGATPESLARCANAASVRPAAIIPAKARRENMSCSYRLMFLRNLCRTTLAAGVDGEEDEADRPWIQGALEHHL